MLAHLAADMCQDTVSVIELDSEHRVGQGLDDPALDFDGAFLSHILHIPGGGKPRRLSRLTAVYCFAARTRARAA
ncbi:hypothetical protein [Corynebacterium otitidis]